MVPERKNYALYVTEKEEEYSTLIETFLRSIGCLQCLFNRRHVCVCGGGHNTRPTCHYSNIAHHHKDVPPPPFPYNVSMWAQWLELH